MADSRLSNMRQNIGNPASANSAMHFIRLTPKVYDSNE